MVPRDFQALSARRAARARTLAERYPVSGEALLFVAEVAEVQARFATSLACEPPDVVRCGEELLALVAKRGPELLREHALHMDKTAWRDALDKYLSGDDTTSARSFFARVLLQPRVAILGNPGSGRRPNCCWSCGHLPQTGLLRREADGTALLLVCSLCFSEWEFPRAVCLGCGERDSRRIAYYTTPEFPHFQTQTCESCRSYVHCVDMTKEADAVPDVDEVAALPLDVWAHAQGFAKLQPNLVGV